MTLYHFGNCIALVYVPYYLTYKYSGLSEYGAFYKCCQAGGTYIFTQLCKLLVLATFFPESLASGEFNLMGEFLRSSIDFIEFLGIALVLSKIPGKGHSKLISVGLGWATAELVLSRGLMLWFGARGAEFSWIYIQKCLESNVLLIQHLSTTALVWLWTRHDLNKKYVPIVATLLMLINFKGVWIELMLRMLSLGAWGSLALKAITTSVIGLATLNIYAGLAQQIGI